MDLKLARALSYPQWPFLGIIATLHLHNAFYSGAKMLIGYLSICNTVRSIPCLNVCCMDCTAFPCSASPRWTGIHPVLVALVRYARSGNGRCSSVSRRKPEPRLHALGRYCVPEVSLIGFGGGASEVDFEATSDGISRIGTRFEEYQYSTVAARVYSRAMYVN